LRWKNCSHNKLTDSQLFHCKINALNIQDRKITSLIFCRNYCPYLYLALKWAVALKWRNWAIFFVKNTTKCFGPLKGKTYGQSDIYRTYHSFQNSAEVLTNQWCVVYSKIFNFQACQTVSVLFWTTLHTFFF
jgi:hypothetical protein